MHPGSENLTIINKRHSDFFVMIKIFIACTLLIGLIFSWLLWGSSGVFSNKSYSQNITIIIPKKSSIKFIGDILVQKSDASLPSFWLTIALAKIAIPNFSLKCGEFLISKEHSLWSIVQLIASGKTVTHTLTIPEGWTATQIAEALNKIPLLEGNISRIPKEGMLLPETYQYKYGDNRQILLNRMEKSMVDFLAKNWHSRKCSDQIIKNQNDVLTLASIVEKETGLSHERPCIAGVFINRLSIGMPLQADPTVAYALTMGQHPLNRKLTFADLKFDSPFNTYVKKGLPPHPIACPGKDAILSVLHPLKTSFLYFVANGMKGHTFSDNFNTHCRNVKEWYAIQNKSKKNT